VSAWSNVVNFLKAVMYYFVFAVEAALCWAILLAMADNQLFIGW
jgi:hypothetical protein